MTLTRLIARSLAYYRGSSLGVAAGAAVGAAVLIGALLVGDSVRGTLRDIALARIGQIENVMVGGDRFFRAELATDDEAAVILLPGSVSRPDARARANSVQVVGVDDRFWRFAPQPFSADDVYVNESLARQLDVAAGDTVIARVEQPSALSRDMPLAGDDDAIAALRVTIAGVVSDDQFGRFSLQANQASAMNLFVPRAMLAKTIDQPGRANLILSRDANATLGDRWTLDDVQLELRDGEVRSERVFIDQPLANLGTPLLTYFVNRIGDTPYSMVTAIDSDVTADLDDDEMVITRWLADDLGANVGDELTLAYYVVGTGQGLQTQQATLRVAKVIATDDPRIDAAMMPDFPGISDAEHCREWDAGFEIDYDAIRDKDEAYWETYRGTPKALVTYATGKRLWANRFGDLTAVRVEGDARAKVRAAVDLQRAGLRYINVRQRALDAVDQSLDFGQLFLGLSFFLIVAAAVLTALLFVFAVEQREKQTRLLAAVGWPRSRIRRWLLGEGLVLSIAGSAGGVAGGVAFTQAILAALSSTWSQAVAGTRVAYHGSAGSMAIGAVSGVIIAMASIAWALRRREARLRARRGGFVVAGLLVVVAVGVGTLSRERLGVAAFFVMGTLLLLAVIAASHGLLSRLLVKHGDDLTLINLAMRGMARRRGRSLAAVALLACGCFMVIAVGAGGHGSSDVGTGGFELYAESTLPIIEKLGDVAMRVREGDDASCLNLNKAQTPTLLGVDPAKFAGRFGLDDWNGQGCVGDEATIVWGLRQSAGDVVTIKNEAGDTVELRIAAIMPNSILQGTLIVSEAKFVDMYPSISGYKRFLFETGDGEALSRQWADYGLAVVDTEARLAMFSAVERAYMSIFAALGALGLLLGTAGLGLIVLRNMLERRSELALLTAIGWRPRKIRKMVWVEHSVLMAMGVVGGSAAACAAVGVNVGAAALVGVMVVSGCVWVWGATGAAMRGGLVEGLRRE